MTTGCIGMKIVVFVHLLTYSIEFFHVCVIKNTEFNQVCIGFTFVLDFLITYICIIDVGNLLMSGLFILSTKLN